MYLVDFGRACDLAREPKPIKSMAGNMPQYTAPEVLDLSYSEKCDMWSIGILTYELLSKRRPFDSLVNDHEEIYKKIRKGLDPAALFEDATVWNNVSRHAKEFIVRCLTGPKRRPRASELLSHQWLTGIVQTPPQDTLNEHL